MESVPVECRYPQPGWVEQDANEIWNAQLYAARTAAGLAPECAASDIVAAGITNQRETTVVWERATGRSGRAGHRLAMPPHGVLLRGAGAASGRGRDHAHDRPGDRRLFLRQQDPLDSRKRARRPRTARDGDCCSAMSTPG